MTVAVAAAGAVTVKVPVLAASGVAGVTVTVPAGSMIAASERRCRLGIRAGVASFRPLSAGEMMNLVARIAAAAVVTASSAVAPNGGDDENLPAVLSMTAVVVPWAAIAGSTSTAVTTTGSTAVTTGSTAVTTGSSAATAAASKVKTVD